MMDMIKEMQALERRYREDQIVEYDRRAAEATTDQGRKDWQEPSGQLPRDGREMVRCAHARGASRR